MSSFILNERELQINVSALAAAAAANCQMMLRFYSSSVKWLSKTSKCGLEQKLEGFVPSSSVLIGTSVDYVEVKNTNKERRLRLHSTWQTREVTGWWSTTIMSCAKLLGITFGFI